METLTDIKLECICLSACYTLTTNSKDKSTYWFLRKGTELVLGYCESNDN